MESALVALSTVDGWAGLGPGLLRLVGVAPEGLLPAGRTGGGVVDRPTASPGIRRKILVSVPWEIACYKRA